MDAVKLAKTQHRQYPVHLVGNTSTARQDKLSNYNTGWEHHQSVRRHHYPGVVFDPEMTFRIHIKRLAGKCFYQLRQLRGVWGALKLDASKAVVHAFISRRVDYCNSIFSLVRTKHLHPLQSVLNAATRVISRRRKYDHISEVVHDQLNWLPITERIEYKLCILVYKCLHQLAPQCLVEMCKVASELPGRRNLRSASRGALIELRTKTSTYGSRSFALGGPRTWNRLPSNLCDHSLSLGQFSSVLKTELFRTVVLC